MRSKKRCQLSSFYGPRTLTLEEPSVKFYSNLLPIRVRKLRHRGVTSVRKAQGSYEVLEKGMMAYLPLCSHNRTQHIEGTRNWQRKEGRDRGRTPAIETHLELEVKLHWTHCSSFTPSPPHPQGCI